MKKLLYILLITSVAGTIFFTLEGKTEAQECGKLLSGQSIGQGQSIVSCDGRFTLTLQTDGYLKLYQSGKAEALWLATFVVGGFTLSMQEEDGNLVLYTAAGAPIWVPPPSGTAGHPGAYLAVQTDGNAVVYDAAGSPLWATNTVVETPSPTCSDLTYPSDKWQRVWYDDGLTCLGNGPDESNEQFDFDNDWGEGIIAYERNDEIAFFSSRTISLSAGTYTFTVGSDDGVRLYIDDELKIDKWIDRGYTTDSVALTFASDGSHRFQLNYYEKTGAAKVSFSKTFEPPLPPPPLPPLPPPPSPPPACPDGSVTLCDGDCIGEPTTCLPVGEYPNLGEFNFIASDGTSYFVDNQVKSVIVPSGYNLRLYDELNYGGGICETLGDGSIVYLERVGWTDKASSAKIILTSLSPSPSPLPRICSEDCGGGGVLLSGQSISQGQSIVSCDGRFTLTMQTDGNLVLYQQGTEPVVWTSETQWAKKLFGEAMGYTLSMQEEDGNLVIYTSSGKSIWTPDWESGAPKYPGASLHVQNDRNMVIYDADCVPRWATNTIQIPSSEIFPGGILRIGNPLNYGSIPELIEGVIKFITWLSLAVTVLMIIIAGFYFVTAAGNTARIQTAKRIILYTLIGLAVILFSRGLIAIIRGVLG